MVRGAAPGRADRTGPGQDRRTAGERPVVRPAVLRLGGRGTARPGPTRRTPSTPRPPGPPVGHGLPRIRRGPDPGVPQPARPPGRPRPPAADHRTVRLPEPAAPRGPARPPAPGLPRQDAGARRRPPRPRRGGHPRPARPRGGGGPRRRGPPPRGAPAPAPPAPPAEHPPPPPGRAPRVPAARGTDPGRSESSREHGKDESRGEDGRHADEEHDPSGSSAGFLRELLAFTREHAHRARLPQFGPLFARLGIPPDVLGPHSRLAAEAARLTDRPSCLLHGDLHRANFIVDPADTLWTIDWELAAFGDPLYDLATHLYLMDYPPRQRARVVAEWRQAVTAVLPGADAGLADDLPRYLAYKRAQSVFADVVRQAVAIDTAHGTPARAEQLGRTAKLVHDVLVRAAEPLELADVPSPGVIELAYAELCTAARLR
ncbi:phosphotransferase [Streptomyces sp. NPDC006992]|uniref:phosphotransferase family protein n=1 Tax=Streptomyces sp. NPDC006992 TaxID=3155601 RepID=UPI0033DE4CE7